MTDLKMERKKTTTTITTKDWLVWLNREQQKKSFSKVSMSDTLDELIVKEFIRLQANKRADKFEHEKRKSELYEKIKKNEYVKDRAKNIFDNKNNANQE